MIRRILLIAVALTLAAPAAGAADTDRSALIHGGADTDNPGWVVSIIVDGEQTCVGALVHPSWVLTSAECATGDGVYRVRTGSDRWDEGRPRAVVRRVTHPDWSPSRPLQGVDLGLLEMATPETGLPLARLAANDPWPWFDQELVVHGWGDRYAGSGPADHLQSALVFSSSDAFGFADEYYCNTDFLTPSDFDRFCFGGTTPDFEPIPDSWVCIGDGGAPLTGRNTPRSNSGPRSTVYGVVSFGENTCATWVTDDIAQRVAPHRDWIMATVDDERCWVSVFDDNCAGDLFDADIVWAADTGVTRGCNPPDNTRFCGERVVTRAEMATFLVRAFDLPEVSGNPFRDVPASNVHRRDIAALHASGITVGCNPPANTSYCPDQPVTRAQMASFLRRALDLPAGPDRFVDVPDANAHRADIDSIAAADITRGCNPPENDRFCPDEPVARDQMAAFLHRIFVNLPT